jgi:2-polyprenyl-3-methyl-5-hydroxy-6-metoxy-1,4-benzoquinol methylase
VDTQTAPAVALNYASVPLINRMLSFFQVANLRTDQGRFRATLEDYLADRVAVEERMVVADNQNPDMVHFHWGHHHDFGDFQLPGVMGTRHIWMLSRFFDHFGVSPESLANRDVLDVGCWTGGVSLILNRLGARVTAIDEIRKYVHALSFIADSFGLESFIADGRSLYELDETFSERFDVVFCLGVVYHLSDPIVALRRLYNVLKPDGTICIESMSIPATECICDYEGPSRKRGDSGWNWFVPSPRALFQWLADTGFQEIQVGDGLTPFTVTGESDPMGENRCFAVAKKDPRHVISVAGLSVSVA